MVRSPQAAYRDGLEAKIPLIIGANSADIGFSTAKTMAEAVAPYGVGNRAHVLQAYDPEGTGNVRLVAARMASDLMMVEPARFTARAFATRGLTAYEYRFSYVAPATAAAQENGPRANMIANKGAQHATDVPYAFDTIAEVLGAKTVPADRAVADTVSTYWTNFAKSGNPNGEGLPQWPGYDAKADVLMNFTPAGSAAAMPDPWQVRLDLTEARATATP